jgi:MFS transporter, DHA1 family, tetracycline resistance protein
MSATTPSRPAGHAVTFILITVLIDTIGFGIVLPVLPELIMELTGEGLSAASRYGGWLAFAYAVMQFLCAPLIGNLSDRFGRRSVLLVSLFAFGVDYVVMGVAPTLGWLFLGRIGAGIAGASYVTANAYVADITPPERRAQSFGLVGAAFGTGFILGPAIGGFLGGLGARAPFFAAAGLALLNLAYGFFVLPESLPRERRRRFELSRANPLGTLGLFGKYRVVLRLAAALFLWQLAHQVLPSTWPYYTMYKFGWNERAIGLSLAAAGVTMIVVQGYLTRVVIPRLGELRAALVGFSFGALGFLGYAIATRGWMMYMWMVVFAPGGFVYPSLNALMSHQVPATEQGALQGGISSLYGLSAITGPILMTQLFGYFSSSTTPVRFAGAAFAMAAMLAIAGLLTVYRRAGESVPEPARPRAPEQVT